MLAQVPLHVWNGSASCDVGRLYLESLVPIGRAIEILPHLRSIAPIFSADRLSARSLPPTPSATGLCVLEPLVAMLIPVRGEAHRLREAWAGQLRR
jgi:hypothetical protein